MVKLCNLTKLQELQQWTHLGISEPPLESGGPRNSNGDKVEPGWHPAGSTGTQSLALLVWVGQPIPCRLGTQYSRAAPQSESVSIPGSPARQSNAPGFVPSTWVPRHTAAPVLNFPSCTLWGPPILQQLHTQNWLRKCRVIWSSQHCTGFFFFFF